MTTNVKKVLHAGISVYNMEESLAWYKKNLGFEVVKNDGYVPPLKAKIVFIEKMDSRLNYSSMMSRKKSRKIV
mgnify:CR=1 FL=1